MTTEFCSEKKQDQQIMEGVTSPPSNPPLPKKPSLAPKPRLALQQPQSSQSVHRDNDSALEKDPSSTSTPPPNNQPASSPAATSNGNPVRPTPRPRKTINLKNAPGGSEGTASPRPQVPPKHVNLSQEDDRPQSLVESSPSSIPNGNGCNTQVGNGVSPTPRVRPKVAARRLTVDCSIAAPKLSPRTSPRGSPTRNPLIRSESSASECTSSLDTDTESEQMKIDSDTSGRTTPTQRLSDTETIETKPNEKDLSVSVEPTHQSPAEKETKTGGSAVIRPKPNISPKKPSLALLAKRNTINSRRSVNIDKEIEKTDSIKKSAPQRPSLPPKRTSGIPSPTNSLPRPEGKAKPKQQQSLEVPDTAPVPQVNGNKSEKLSETVPSTVDSISNSAVNSCDNPATNSTLISSTVTHEKPQKKESSETPKAPPHVPRKTVLRNPIAPPRRVKSMSESDSADLNVDRFKYRAGGNQNPARDHSPESVSSNAGGEVVIQSKSSECPSNGAIDGERSTLKRNRKAVKSCDPLAFGSMRTPSGDTKQTDSETQGKAKPPRPPPPSKPAGLIHQASLQGPPPRPKPVRAKTIEVTSATRELEAGKETAVKSKLNQMITDSNGGRSPPNSDVSDGSEWEFVDLTAQEKKKIDAMPNRRSSKMKVMASELSRALTSHKVKSSKEEKNHEGNVQPGKQESENKESMDSEECKIDAPEKDTGEAVSQLKQRKSRPPMPAQRNSMEGSPVHSCKSPTTSVPEKIEVTLSDAKPTEVPSRPLSQGSPVNGRSPLSSPKKTLKDRGRGSSPRRPSCPPPPPPGSVPGAASPACSTPEPQVGSSRAPSSVMSPKPTVPPEEPVTPKPKRPAPPRPNIPPGKNSPHTRKSSPKRPPPTASPKPQDDQANIYTEANSPGPDDGDSDESSRDHDYELIPDPRRTLPRNADPPSCNSEQKARKEANRASGYIDDGLYLEPNGKEDGEMDNEYVYPEFVPPEDIPVTPPPPLPPNPELDPVFEPSDASPSPIKNRRASNTKRRAPQKPQRSQSMQSNTSSDSHSYCDMSLGIEGLGRGRIPRSPSDRSGSTDSSGDEDASLSDEEDEDEVHYAGVADIGDVDDGFDELELPEARKRLQSLGRKAQKAFMVAKEIKDSEKVFVDVLKLLNVDLRQVLEESKKNGGKPIIEKGALDQILGHLPHLQIFNECLLTDLETRIRNWATNPRIADIFLTKGHFLKLYSQYILDFERITAAFDEQCNKNPVFSQVVREFEMSERCRSLAIKHYMLKPVQRIPQYKMLLTDYQKQLDANTEEYSKTSDALLIVSEVANHANESMRQGDNFEKLLAIQHSLIGSQEIVKPGRRFIKEGELQKLSRRVNQPRKFFLLSDLLLHTTPFPPGQYKLNNELSLAGMKVHKSSQENSNELSIISVQRSFTLLAPSQEECESWYNALTKTIDEYENKKSSFDLVRPEQRVLAEGDTSSLGRKAPLWIPDSRVTMCMICTSEFTITWRRHHCRACGKVTCGHCSKNKAPLTYLADKEARVCDNCHETLVLSQEKEGKERVKNKSNKTKRRSNRLPVRSNVLKVGAKDQTNSSMSGYLWCRSKKKDWKKMWYRIKDKVLYTYKASEDVVALQSIPLLGYAVCVINETFEGFEAGLILQLTQGPIKHILRTDSFEACEKWNEAMLEASCLD